MIVNLSLIKFKLWSYDWYKRKETKRKNAFKKFESRIKENAFRCYGIINITKSRGCKTIDE